METETQRRKRVVGRIRRDLLERLSDDLTLLAEAGKFPETWLGPRELNRILDDTGYWLNHDDPMAPFLAPHACVSLLENALSQLASNGSSAWWRDGERFRANAGNWAEQARETANRLRRECPDAERTALYGGPDEPSVIFGSDRCTTDPVARRQINVLRQHLRAAGVPELAFASSDDDQTWVMLVWSNDASLLHSALFAAWQQAVCA